MKRIPHGLLVSCFILFFVLFSIGCGGGDGRTVFTAQILSDQPSDGEIIFDNVAFQILNGPDTLFFGIDGSFRERRAFLDFPLDGTTGQDVVPLNASIESATLTVRIVSVQFAVRGRVPTLLDLVTYTPGSLSTVDYDSPPLTFPEGGDASRTFDLFSTDVGLDVEIEVTSLMREVQRRGLSDFQVRFLLDFVAGADGFVGIDDPPDVAITAPLLTVRYR
jgi:hypothetical protein